jgi:NAD+ synthase (glutamine-hydrolysing)
MTHKPESSLRVVMAQQNYLVGDVHANARQILAACVRARDEMAADAIVFPELALTGYPPEDLLLRPHFIEHVEAAVASLRREITGITAIIGYPLQQQDELYNVAGVFQEGAITTYLKQHLPNYSVFDEQRYFTPGAEPCIVHINGVPTGITVCEDIWEPGPVRQAYARLLLQVQGC